jgi:hypothetical protein
MKIYMYLHRKLVCLCELCAIDVIIYYRLFISCVGQKNKQFMSVLKEIYGFISNKIPLMSRIVDNILCFVYELNER